MAREGGLAPASRVLRLAHPTLSGQIRRLEDQLGEKLFVTAGRGRALSETGKVVYRYADEIFGLGREMLDTIRGLPTGKPMRLTVGVAEVMPKLIVRRLLEPALLLPLDVRLICVEDRPDRLLPQLALHELDIVLSDAPLPAGSPVRAFSHLLGESGVSFFGTKKFAQLKRGFPHSLDGQPMLLPLSTSPLRRALSGWLDTAGIRPRVVAEFDDSALTNVFGSDGVGIFMAPTVVGREVRRQHGVLQLGQVPEIRERFYAYSVERRLKHPAVLAIINDARRKLFARQERRARARGV